ncbi:MAG: NTPase [Armatimonadota bacterium]|nr:MAG: NTPase [Armatimonadota bacterium]
MTKHLLITGPPGCGKTTIVRAVVEQLRQSSARPRGFWTEEMRERGARTGFRIETIAGATGTLARVGVSSPHRVGRYGVDIEGFESVGVAEVEAALAEAQRGEPVVLVIDEIGKMELFSERFCRAVERAFSEVPHVLATIMQRSHPFADALKARCDVRLLTVTGQNRAALPAEALRQLL